MNKLLNVIGFLTLALAVLVYLTSLGWGAIDFLSLLYSKVSQRSKSKSPEHCTRSIELQRRPLSLTLV